MGYRSEVAYAIVFKSTEDRDKILSRITPEQQKIVREEAYVREDRILFHHPSIKWYLTRELADLGIKDGGYPNVDAHDALVQAAMEAQYDYDHQENARADEGAVYSMGIFLRIGEDDADTERDAWGDFDAPEGFPALYDLVDYRREIAVGW